MFRKSEFFFPATTCQSSNIVKLTCIIKSTQTLGTKLVTAERTGSQPGGDNYYRGIQSVSAGECTLRGREGVGTRVKQSSQLASAGQRSANALFCKALL